MSAEKFGRYVIKGELGRGGMATVFHAYDPRFERDVAIKVLPREFLHDPQFRVRFEREAKTIALIEHSAIVPVYDFGEEEGQPYIVMRYMSGGSLSDRLAQGALPLDEVTITITRLAPALDAAHKKGIIHRDLKPANILYDQYGNGFLSDFGIARITQSSTVTLTGGAILGTPAYMSPEQVQGGLDIDGRSDIYALGVILFQVLCGKTPYQADTAAKLMMMHILEPVPHITDTKEEIPSAFNEIIEKAMAKDPDDRFQNTEAMARAVEMATQGMDAVTILGPKVGPTDVGKTRLRPAGATVFSRSAHKQTDLVEAATRVGALPKISAPAAGRSATPVALPRAGIPSWVWILGGVVIFSIIVGFFTLGGGMLLLSGRSTPTLAITNTSEVVVDTPIPTNTLMPSPASTDTPVLLVGFTNTPAPTATETLLPPTDTQTPLPPLDTATPVPIVLVLGGSDKLAFISDNDIFIVNLDGTDLVRLTADGGSKTHLQWKPDGSALVYITGLCIKIVEINTLRIDNILCLEYAMSLDAFAISMDGLQIAIVVNQELFLVPFNLESLAQVDYWDAIQALATCPAFAPYSTTNGTAYAVREVHWSRDQLQLTLIVPVPEGGVAVDAVRVINISQCVNNPPRVDEFPGNRFTMSGYPANPNILHVGYDGRFLFALTNIQRNEGFGDLFLYNMDSYRSQNRVNPIEGRCCYRDPQFSPDGTYITFAFQDISQGAQSTIQLYYIPFATLGTGLVYSPIPLPGDLFNNQRESPQPVLRPVAITP
jgi:serine/threonine protein kinase